MSDPIFEVGLGFTWDYSHLARVHFDCLVSFTQIFEIGWRDSPSPFVLILSHAHSLRCETNHASHFLHSHSFLTSSTIS